MTQSTRHAAEDSATQALHDAGFKIGDLIEAGEGDGHDTGRIIGLIDARLCRVAWSNGETTPCPIEDMQIWP